MRNIGQIERIRILLFFALLLLLSNQDYAQFKFGFSTNQIYDSNPFRLSIAESEIISSYNGGIEYDFSKVNLLYYGSYSLFNKSIDRNFYWHQLGLYKSSDDYMYGFYGEQRINKKLYNYYDYISATGYIKRRIDSTFGNPIISVSGTYKNYKNLSDYNNVFLNAGISLNKGFETKTSLLLNASLNYKYYPNTEMSSNFNQESSTISSTQIYLNLRAAQSLFENTGLAVYYLNRSLLGNSLSPANDYYTSFGDESDLYDDPNSRDENAIGLELTHILPAEIITKTGYELSYRKYPSQGIYTDAEIFETGELRNDTQNSFYISASKVILLDESSNSSLNLSINYSLINKTSNSYWYAYNGSIFSINLGIQF